MTENSNAAQVRGDIQLGRTGDKRSGFDPALAPMETDGEAVGTPLTPSRVAPYMWIAAAATAILTSIIVVVHVLGGF